VCNDPGLKDTLNFLMSREVAHQKMFEAALDAITPNFPPGTLPGQEGMNHAYVADSGNFGENGAGAATEGFVRPSQQLMGLRTRHRPRRPRRRAASRPPSGRPPRGDPGQQGQRRPDLSLDPLMILGGERRV